MASSVTPAGASPATSTGDARIDFHQWKTPGDFAAGSADGVRPTPAGLVVAHAVGSINYTDPDLGTTKPYEYATWTSPTYRQGFGATQLVASWNATTPAGTWLQVEMRGHTTAGAATGWYVMGRWASGDGDIHRTSVPGQSDAAGTIDVDTFEAGTGVTLGSYQLRVTLYRTPGSRLSPTLRMVGAMTSAVPDRFTVPASPPGGAEGIELPVPRYSQDVHDGEYPQWDGGGEAWCSPTSNEMVVEYWGKHPSPAQMSFVDPSYPDPSVDVAARDTYDYNYQGTGNWPFNTAYAASYGLSAHITRLHSLDELESYIKRGIPVVTSQSFEADELTGSGYSTAGHLMVIIGFTANGDVIANDPASPDDAAVRRVYNRHQFETVWLRTERVLTDGSIASGSGGVAYIITPPGLGG
ncbi:MAG TPA: C39 family peptidase [Pseudonocardiaceae bacterium]|nr:C39 family peptidase [Pseudonocardiaceae bacterium]